MSDLIERLRRPFTSTPTSSMNLMSDAANLIEAQQAEIARLLELMGKQAIRFDHCADMIESSFDISGTLRMERALQASAYAFEARAALEQKP